MYTIEKSSGIITGPKSMYLHGPMKIGKTSFALGAPGAYLLALEQRYKHLKADRVTDVTDWETFRKICQDLNNKPDKFKGVEYVIIDTADNAWDYADAYYCEKHEIDHVSDHQWGKGSSALKTEFRRTINELFASRFKLIFISHTEDIECQTKGGDRYTKTVSTLNKHAKSIILKQVGPIGYCKYKSVIVVENGKRITKDKRVISFKGSEEVESGDGEGKLPDEITLLPNSKESFRRFLSYYEDDDDKD